MTPQDDAGPAGSRSDRVRLADGPPGPPAPGRELDRWSADAEDWIAKAERIAELSRPATEALLRRLAPGPGQALLDVACGAGDPALQLARRVGPTGRVLATDGVAAMAAALARRAADLGLTWLTTAVGPAEALDLPAASFDGACSRFGAMFFDDVTAGLASMARAVVPGGRLVAVAWGEPAANAWFTLVLGVLDEVGAPPPPPGRSPLHLSAPGALATHARAAGWRAVRDERVPFVWRLAGVAPDGLLDAQAALSRSIPERLAALGAAARERARRLVAERAAAHADGDDLALPAQCVVVSGRAG